MEEYLIKEEPLLHESGARLGTQKSYSIPICNKDGCKQLQQYKQQIDDLKKQLQKHNNKEDKLITELENFNTQFEIDETIPLNHLKSKKEILQIARQNIKNVLQILKEHDKE